MTEPSAQKVEVLLWGTAAADSASLHHYRIIGEGGLLSSAASCCCWLELLLLARAGGQPRTQCPAEKKATYYLLIESYVHITIRKF